MMPGPHITEKDKLVISRQIEMGSIPFIIQNARTDRHFCQSKAASVNEVKKDVPSQAAKVIPPPYTAVTLGSRCHRALMTVLPERSQCQ